MPFIRNLNRWALTEVQLCSAPLPSQHHLSLQRYRSASLLCPLSDCGLHQGEQLRGLSSVCGLAGQKPALSPEQGSFHSLSCSWPCVAYHKSQVSEELRTGGLCKERSLKWSSVFHHQGSQQQEGGPLLYFWSFRQGHQIYSHWSTVQCTVQWCPAQ